MDIVRAVASVLSRGAQNARRSAIAAALPVRAIRDELARRADALVAELDGRRAEGDW
ncbi:hypothetical protein [Thermoleophilum album]|uniref:hypothetical protein n=1 Tax=Thermoleophilum album TaxID=29539 RepID=UPI0015A57B48|nr:hypothetical protein [Thermoleophilum album]